MTRSTQIIFWAGVALTILSFIATVTGGGSGWLTTLCAVVTLWVAGRTALQCAPYRLTGEKFLACVKRRSQELRQEAAYPRLINRLINQSAETGSTNPHDQFGTLLATVTYSQGVDADPLGRRHPVMVDCENRHTIIVWSEHPVAVGDPVECPLHNRLGPAEAACVHVILPGVPGDLSTPTVHSHR